MLNQVTFSAQAPFNKEIDNKADHTATINYDNGDQYKGELSGGKRDGNGLYTFSNGDTYKGSFEANQMQGKGEYTTDDGDVYDGLFINNAPSGYGTLTWLLHNNYHSYAGQWDNATACGKGTLEFLSGDRYDGKFMAGSFHGKGVLTYSNGDCFDGNYVNGYPSGKGKMLFAEAKVVMNRNFNNLGVDRADTKELKKGTFSLTKKKKKKGVKVLKDTYKQRSSGAPNPNLAVMNAVLGNLGLSSKGKRATKKAAKVVRRRTAANKAATTKRATKKKKRTTWTQKAKTALKTSKRAATTKVLATTTGRTVTKTPVRVVKRATKISKAKKRRRTNYQRWSANDLSYLEVQRTNFCGVSRRKREPLNLQELFADINDGSQVRRPKSVLRCFEVAKSMLGYSSNTQDQVSVTGNASQAQATVMAVEDAPDAQTATQDAANTQVAVQGTQVDANPSQTPSQASQQFNATVTQIAVNNNNTQVYRQKSMSLGQLLSTTAFVSSQIAQQNASQKDPKLISLTAQYKALRDFKSKVAMDPLRLVQ